MSLFSQFLQMGRISFECLAQPYLFVVVVLLLQSPYLKALGSSETDHLALLAFKAAITHDPHDFLRSWNATVPFCQWPGVTCRGQNKTRVTSLVLESEGVEGSLSPYIGNLTFLAALHLPNNTLSGSIPAQIGQLSSLYLLNLSSNSLEGTIPPILGLCKDLVRIDLTSNSISGSIPFELGSLPKLQVLSLGSNTLTRHIPPWSAGNLSSLQRLYLSYNNLSGDIPLDNHTKQRKSSRKIVNRPLAGTVRRGKTTE